MRKQREKPPSYRLHRASGQAIVTLSGKMFYLGPHGTKVSKSEYDRVVGEWMANGRTLPQPSLNCAGGHLTVLELVNAFRKAKPYPDSQGDAFIGVMKLLNRTYGRSAANDFGSLALKVVRAKMVEAGWKRKTVNGRVHCLRAIFSWGIEHELIDGEKMAAMKEVKPLKEGRTAAPESVPVQAVDIEHVNTCMLKMTPTLAAMVKVQLFAGMRAGEVCQMTTGDIDVSDPTCWVYRPGNHKTKHKGKMREIALGAQAMEAIRLFLLPDLAAPIFSPARATAERLKVRNEKRKTATNAGNSPGTNRLPSPQKVPGTHYNTYSYRRAIEYATQQAFPPPTELARTRGETKKEWRERLGPKNWVRLKAHHKAHHWSTHQLRHAFGTLVINKFTAEHAQKSLGHSNMKVTAIYAKLSLDKAKEVARAIG